jgi:hypothetical protein
MRPNFTRYAAFPQPRIAARHTRLWTDITKYATAGAAAASDVTHFPRGNHDCRGPEGIADLLLTGRLLILKKQICGWKKFTTTAHEGQGQEAHIHSFVFLASCSSPWCALVVNIPFHSCSGEP